MIGWELCLIVGLGSAGLIFFVCGRWSQKHHERRLARELAAWRRSKDYWGIRIIPGKGKTGCQHARNMQDRILSMGSVPALPLARCSHSNCRCRYSPYPERRRAQRRGGSRRETLRYVAASEERRGPHDRRSSDKLWEEVRQGKL